MQPTPPKNIHAAELGIRGGKKRMAQLNATERSEFSKLALRARWHRREYEAEKEDAQRKAYLFQQALQALQNDKQLPLV
jgi:hypothetical protein